MTKWKFNSDRELMAMGMIHWMISFYLKGIVATQDHHRMGPEQENILLDYTPFLHTGIGT